MDRGDNPSFLTWNSGKVVDLIQSFYFSSLCMTHDVEFKKFL